MNQHEQRVAALGHTIDDAPTAERIATYRAIASTTTSVPLATHFFACADALAAAEQKIGQLSLDFTKPTSGHNGTA